MNSKYIVSLWPGVGYYTKQITVNAFSEQGALEAALAFCEAKGLNGLFIEVDEMNEDLTDEERDEIYIYVDPTFEGTNTRPAYIYAENLDIQIIA